MDPAPSRKAVCPVCGSHRLRWRLERIGRQRQFTETQFHWTCLACGATWIEPVDRHEHEDVEPESS